MSRPSKTYRGALGGHGFARVATATFWTKPMDVRGNLERHLAMVNRADSEGAQLLVFPELGLSGYGCRDAFNQMELLDASLDALRQFCSQTATNWTVFVVGLPLMLNRLFNVAAVVNRGRVIAFVPKSYLAARGEWQEGNWFAPASELRETEVSLPWQKEPVPIGTDILVDVTDGDGKKSFMLGVEICEDGWQANSPGDRHAHNGADVIANLSASNWILGKDQWRLKLFPANSGRQKSAYVYANLAGDSTSGMVWDGQSFIAEDGNVLAESKRWLRPTEDDLIVADVDILRLRRDRMTDGGWGEAARLNAKEYLTVHADARFFPDTTSLFRPLTRLPFVPKDPAAMKKVGEEFFNALAQGVIGRLWHIGGGKPVPTYMGLSGGLDSTLAFLISCYAYDRVGWDRSFLHAVRMPGPGSSDRTQDNSARLAEALGTSVKTIDITELAELTLRKAGHEPCWNCLTCENAQARVRTLALKTLGFNLGTSDMSETAKGYCTEGGDQSSHFHVIANVPKTLACHLILYYIEYMAKDDEKETLRDILATKISGELRRLKPGEVQESESAIGPFDLLDFIKYHFLRTGAGPKRMAYLAGIAFGRVETVNGVEQAHLYDRATILKWVRDYYVKFGFAQYKRNASPDSVLVGSVGLGAHDKQRWPSDGSMQPFTDCVDEMIAQLGN